MKEEEIIINENFKDLLNNLLKEGLIDEFESKGYKIIYFGEKSSSYFESLINNYPINENSIEEIQSHLDDTNDTRNYILYIKYKDIYIGGLSIFDFQSKEGFGLYKYPNNPDKSFYLGQWEENQKSGKGFLKIDNNHLYLGNFKNNQMHGDGLYYNKKNGNYFYGLFNNGMFEKGLYCNLLKDIFYIGRFKNNKKNDDFCCYFNHKKNKLFFGEVKNDLFIKGNIIFLSIKETEKEIDMKIEKLIYYGRNKKNDSRIINKKGTNETIEAITCNAIQLANYTINDLGEIIKLFDELEETFNESSYNNAIGRYNNYENEFSFEKDFIESYNFYLNKLNDNLDNLDIKEIKKTFIN